MKALKPFRSFFCLAHRLNNILKHAFYQSMSKKITNSHSSNEINHTVEEDESDAEDSDSDDDNESCYSAASIDDLSENALSVLKTIGECKKLVKYVKKVVRFLLPTFYFLYFL